MTTTELVKEFFNAPLKVTLGDMDALARAVLALTEERDRLREALRLGFNPMTRETRLTDEVLIALGIPAPTPGERR